MRCDWAKINALVTGETDDWLQFDCFLYSIDILQLDD